MRRPDFFIVGAPKSGTTALGTYLAEHPRVFMHSGNEPTFFASEISGRNVRSMNSYLALFASADSNHQAVGEKSVLYLSSPRAISEIHDFNRNASLIVMLRNPVDLVYSWHQQLRWLLEEDETDFSSAWRLQAARRQGRHVPDTSRVPRALQYYEIGSLGSQVERLLEVFPRDRVLLLLFDDFVKSPKLEYDRTLEFLGVSNDGRTTFPRINERSAYRSRTLQRLLTRPPRAIASVVKAIKHVTGIESTGVGRALVRRNRRTEAATAMGEELRAELVQSFSGEVDKLAEILQQDLSAWL